MLQQRKKGGFATMDKAQHREICSKGGRAAHAKGTAHEWTGGKQGTAADAGRKGGMAVIKKHGLGHMGKIGKKGGERRGQKNANAGAIPVQVLEDIDELLSD